jgi:hypothetical protein
MKEWFCLSANAIGGNPLQDTEAIAGHTSEKLKQRIAIPLHGLSRQHPSQPKSIR